MLGYIGAAFLGWSLGANDSANTFGTAVGTRMISARLAVVLIAVFVIIGATMQGAAGVETIHQLSHQTSLTAVVSSFSAALTVTLMTILKLPVSTSQAVVGAILGVGLAAKSDVAWQKLIKVVACWIGTPIGAILFSFVIYYVLRTAIRLWRPSIFVYDPFMRWALIICGCYSAYALGANNVANVTAVFAGDIGVQTATILGGVCIAGGALTFGHTVMRTVGKGVVKLDAFSALVCVLSLALTVHVYAMVGVPVSTSQGIIGAVLGIGFIKGLQTVNGRMLRRVCLGWLATPFVAAGVGALIFTLSRIELRP